MRRTYGGRVVDSVTEGTYRLMMRLVLVLLVLSELTLTDQPGGAAEMLEFEPALEPEFRQLRERLRTSPEYRDTDARSTFRFAEELARRGDVHGAMTAYRAAIALEPAWAEPYHGLGRVLLDHHDYAMAADALKTGIRLGQDHAQSWYWLARAFMGAGELPDAAAALERATRLSPEDAEAFADLALVRMAEGDLSGAEQALATSIAVKPDYADAHRLQEALSKHRQDPAQAMKTAQHLLAELFARP